MKFNRLLVEDEKQAIEDFILRYRWRMDTTPTGLRYMIYREGKGRQPVANSKLSIHYSVSLLNGDRVYATHPDLPFVFEPGRRDVISGLEEGVLLLREGGRAKIVVPSHLAFGLLGDLDRIPSGATLVYDVELLSVEPLKK